MQFEDGMLLDLVEDAKNPSTALLAVWDPGCGSSSFVKRFERDGQVFVPLRRDRGIVKSFELPSGVERYDSPAKLAREAGALVNEVVPISEGLRLLLGAFVVFSWVPGAAPFCPCPLILGPSDFTGPLVQILALLCRHALMVGHATVAGLLEAYSRMSPTLLICDGELRPDVLRLLSIGTRRDVIALHKGTAVSPFGPRLIASSSESTCLNLFEDAIAFPLRLGPWPDWAKLSDRATLEQAGHLRNRLLQFRFDRGGSVQPLVGGRPSGLSAKGWDWSRILAGPFVEDEEFCSDLLGSEIFPPAIFPYEQQPQSLSPKKQATLSTVFYYAHKKYALKLGPDEEERYYSAPIGELTDFANQVLEKMGESPSLTARGFGAQLDALGFAKRERGDHGAYECDFGRTSFLKQIHYLVKHFGVWDAELYHGQDRARCKWCRSFEVLSHFDKLSYEVDVKTEIECLKQEERARRQKTVPPRDKRREGKESMGKGRPR